MARWPVDPTWIDPDDGINEGNQYVSADGVTISDFNNLIKDIIYLRNKAAPTIQPTKTVNITTNGTFSATPDTGYDALAGVLIHVNVPAPEPTLQEKTVTTNGVVTPDEGYDGLSKVTVNVLAVYPTLYAPSITLSGTTLTITPNTNNGGFNTGVTYQLLDLSVGATYNIPTGTLSIDLTDYITEEGTHELKVKANRVTFNSSQSNSVTYEIAPEAWDTPTIQLEGSIVSTEKVEGVTKYKVYVDDTYTGYVDDEGTYHDV